MNGKEVKVSNGKEVKVSMVTPPPLKARSPEEAASGLPTQSTAHEAGRSTRAGRVLALLDSDLRTLNRVFDVEIVEARQSGPETVELIYRYPGYDGLIGLRRDVGVQAVDLDPGDKHYALAKNDNSPREIATMLRIELEEPQRPDSFTVEADGVQWWGD